MDKLKVSSQKDGERFKQLEDKCAEYENQIFDLQMENIQLKSELEKLRRDEE